MSEERALPMIWAYSKRLSVVALLAVGIAACSDAAADETSEETPDEPTPRVIQPGAPGEPATELTPEDLEALEPLPHIEADIVFMQMMIVHHQQALDMTGLVPDRTEREDIPLLAQRMEISQRDEIALMEDWLEARGEPVATESTHGDAGSSHGMVMAGYLNDDQFAELEAASGEEFDRLFLERMIHHHEGALQMITQLVEENGGQEAEIGVLVNHFYADQEIEIIRMQGLLAEMDG